MPAFPFIVQQQEYPIRGVVLQGRSLPYRGTTWGGTQELDVNWFSGNPVAVVQVLGPREDPIEITGQWKDKFLYEDQNAAKLYNFPPLTIAAQADADVAGSDSFEAGAGGAAVGEQAARRARALRDAFDLMRREGVLCKIEWGSLARYGFVASTSFPHQREEDIEYTISFTIIGKEAAQERVLPRPTVDVLSMLKQMLRAMDAILNRLATAAFVAQKWANRVNQTIIKIGSFVTQLLEIIEELASFAFAPADTFGIMKAQLTGIRLAALDLFQTLDEGASAVIEASLRENPALMAMNNALQQQVRIDAAKLAALAAENEAILDEKEVSELSAVTVISGEQTLKDVAREATGDPADWPQIAEFNGFSSSVVPRGTVVRVPRL